MQFEYIENLRSTPFAWVTKDSEIKMSSHVPYLPRRLEYHTESDGRYDLIALHTEFPCLSSN
jgi:hypothetical protein